jgi:hypothetical protein
MPTDFYDYAVGSWVYLMKDVTLTLDPDANNKQMYNSSNISEPGGTYRIVPFNFRGPMNTDCAVPYEDAINLDSATNFEEVFDMIQYKGTISDIDTSNDTATVTVDGEVKLDIPIFYYCDAAITDISGGSSAFTAEDNVVVEVPNNDWDDAKIIGFPDEIKACGRVILVFYLYDKGMLAVQIDEFETITRYPLKDYYNPEEPATIEPISGNHFKILIFNGLTLNDSINSKDLSFFSDAGITHEDSAYGVVTYGACENEVYHEVSCICGHPYEGRVTTHFCLRKYRNNVTSSFAEKEEGPLKY